MNIRFPVSPVDPLPQEQAEFVAGHHKTVAGWPKSCRCIVWSEDEPRRPLSVDGWCMDCGGTGTPWAEQIPAGSAVPRVLFENARMRLYMALWREQQANRAVEAPPALRVVMPEDDPADAETRDDLTKLPMPAPGTAVELSTCYRWTCPRCKAMNVVDSVPMELTPEEKRETENREGVDLSGFRPGDLVSAPDSVACLKCGAELSVKNDPPIPGDHLKDGE